MTNLVVVVVVVVAVAVVAAAVVVVHVVLVVWLVETLLFALNGMYVTVVRFCCRWTIEFSLARVIVCSTYPKTQLFSLFVKSTTTAGNKPQLRFGVPP